MKKSPLFYLFLPLALLMAGCENDDPRPGGDVITVKTEENRTVLIGGDDGKVYDMKTGAVHATLPGCMAITGMAMHGENWYAAGTATDGVATYWVNGKARQIDAKGTTMAVTRSYDNVYVAGKDNEDLWAVFKNGEHTKLSTNAIPVAIAANGDNWYAPCNTESSAMMLSSQALPHTFTVGAFVTGIDLAVTATGTTRYLSGYALTTVDGQQMRSPRLWVNEAIHSLPVNATDKETGNNTYRSGQALDVTHKGQDIYVVGSRHNGAKQVATVWVTSASSDTDQTRTYWQSDGNIDAWAARTLVYGVDVYVMTIEHDKDNDTYRTRIWMNHELKGTVGGVCGVGFVVI